MNKRLFALLLSLLLLLPLLPAFALDPCEHISSGEVADDELEMMNVVAAQEGVDGSADLCCPICHQIVDSIILPALPAPADHAAASDAETQSESEPEPEPEPELELEPEPEPVTEVREPEPLIVEPEELQQPIQQEKPSQREEPVKAIQPEETAVQSESVVQAKSAAQADSVTQKQSEKPVRAVKSEETAVQSESIVQAKPAAQADSAAQKQSEEPVKTAQSEETAVQSESVAQTDSATQKQSEEPIRAAQPEETVAQENRDTGAVILPKSKDSEQTDETQADPPKAEDVIANLPPENENQTDSGTATDKTKTIRTTVYTAGYQNTTQTETTPQKHTYPYRRIKMKPRKGIRAEIPGILIWPANGTPFQILFND